MRGNMEYWDIYDRQRIKKNKIVPKGIAREQLLADDDYIMIVHACIFNSRGQMLIQQRQPFKEGWSNLWDVSAGGRAIAGDTSQMAAERELFEELGIKIDLQQARPVFTINFEVGFDDFYVINRDLSLDQLVLQETEVKAVTWATQSEVLELIDKKLFIPYRNTFINFLFEYKDGAINGAIYSKWRKSLKLVTQVTAIDDLRYLFCAFLFASIVLLNEKTDKQKGI